MRMAICPSRNGPMLLLFMLAALPGCTVAPYDQTTDDSLTSIQKRFDDRIASLKQGSTASTQPSFYADLENDIHSLALRNEARSQGDPSLKKEAQALDELAAEVDGMSKLEKTGNVPAGALDTAQKQFDAAVQSVLALELQRKK